jgi:hypothetical protein
MRSNARISLRDFPDWMLQEKIHGDEWKDLRWQLREGKRHFKQTYHFKDRKAERKASKSVIQYILAEGFLYDVQIDIRDLKYVIRWESRSGKTWEGIFAIANSIVGVTVYPLSV